MLAATSRSLRLVCLLGLIVSLTSCGGKKVETKAASSGSLVNTVKPTNVLTLHR